jgi:hypothetical protein
MQVWLFLLCMLAILVCFSMSISHGIVGSANHVSSTTTGQSLFIEKLLAALVSAVLGLICVVYICRAGEEVERK